MFYHYVLVTCFDLAIITGLSGLRHVTLTMGGRSPIW